MLCLVVRTLSAQTCVFIFRVYAAGNTDSYNIRETETKDLVENLVPMSKELS